MYRRHLSKILLLILLLSILFIPVSATEYAYGVCTASSEYSVQTCGKAFDNNGATYHQMVSAALPGWVQNDYGAGVTRIINNYTYQDAAGINRYWTAWQFWGSNGADKVYLSNQTGQSFTNGEIKRYVFTNTVAYRYYGFNVTACNTNAYCSVAELELIYDPDTTPPMNVSALAGSVVSCSAIDWTWTDPTDADFKEVLPWLNNIKQTNVTKGVQVFHATGLTASTAYTFSTKTVDTSENVNNTWYNNTQTTSVCPTTSPTPTPTATTTEAPSTDVYGVLGACDSIRWRLAVPVGDFNGTMIYRNNTYLYNVTNATTSETWTGLYEGIIYTISSRAFYFNTSVNNTWKNASSQTALCGCWLCGLTTSTPEWTIPNIPAVYDDFWLKDWVMRNAWWLILLIGALLVLKRK